MDHGAAIIMSCWFAVATVSSIYMWVFRGLIADILFGVFLPIGFLMLVAIVVTLGVASNFERDKKREAQYANDLLDVRSRLNVVTREIEQIKKEIEQK